MASFVLVHGAWHGGWCWDRVAGLLAGQGHNVLAPTLTGLGARAAELTPEVSLGTHIDDVVAALDVVDVPAVAAGEEIVLAGHSYGGMLVTAASNRRPGLVSRLVYLDAFLPGDGQSQWDLMAPAARTAFTRRAQEFGDGWRVPPPTDLASLGVTSPIDQSWVGERLTAHPLRTFLEPLALSSFSGQPPVRRYIACQREVSPFSAQEDALRADPNWEYHEIVAGHDAMITHPEEIADLFSRSS